LPDASGTFETIRVERDGPVATVVLDRPERRNPLSLLAYREIVSALQAADDDPAVRCCVVTGAGPAFSSGGELGGEPHETVHDWFAIHEELARSWTAVRDLRTPVIAAVNGLCYGSGVILALHCDLVVAARSARFGFVETRMGLAGIGMLAHVVGPQWAKFLALSGEVIGARRAREIGLVLEVVADERFTERIADLARRIAAMPVPATVLNKRNVNVAVDTMGWLLTRDFNRSHYPVIDAMSPYAEATDGRRFADIMRDDGWKAFLAARDAPFADPWLED
jgi:enoyl-CoA hydratase/carnithine racemase